MRRTVKSGGYNGPGRWRYGLGFVESGGFLGGEGSFAGCESATMLSPTRQTTVEVVSTKLANAIAPPPMIQALAMAIYGTNIGFGLTPTQALQPNSFTAGVEAEQSAAQDDQRVGVPFGGPVRGLVVLIRRPSTSVPEFARLFAGAKWIRTIGPAKMEQRFETPVRPFGTFPFAKETDASGERDRRFESPSLH